MEGPIFGRAYVRREICISKLIGLACSGKEIYHFCFVLLCIRGQIPSTSPPGGLYSQGQFNRGFFALRFWGLIFGETYTRRGLFSEFYDMVRKAIVIICYTHSQHSLEQLYNSIVYSMCMPVHVLLILKYLTAIL